MTREPHPLARKTVRLRDDMNHPALDGAIYRVEGRWVDVAGKSWGDCDGNPACLGFAIRAGLAEHDIPGDDAGVLYGKVGPYGHLVHESEIIGEVSDAS